MSDAIGFKVIDFGSIAPVTCPCGMARRALLDVEQVPYSLHITEISSDARAHYHRYTTETYFVLECDSDGGLEINGTILPASPQKAVVIFPGTWHRAVGRMKVVIIASPKFDPADEWLD